MEKATIPATAASPYASDFGPFDGRVWLNTAHQGALPRTAVQAVEASVAEKRAPHRIADEAFLEVPRRLRDALGQLIGASPDDVVLGNSATYGLDLLAHSIRWEPGDQVLLVDGDFPADVYPWLPLQERGVVVRFLTAHAGDAPGPNELAAAITGRTRLFCASWVNSFTGHALDPQALGRVCRDANVTFVLNASQGLGARPLDVSRLPIDVVTCCGYKWLLGPYGTGFCWITPVLRESLTPPHSYWLPNVWGQAGGMQNYALRSDLGARAYDVFCTANFLNFAPWTAAVEYLLAAGQDAVEQYDQGLVDHLVTQVDRSRYEVVSPAMGRMRSTLVVLRPKGGRDAREVHRVLTAARVDTAVREGSIRLSPHLYNTLNEIHRAVQVLNNNST